MAHEDWELGRHQLVRLSIVIVTFNGEDLIEAALRSIPNELIARTFIVDNNSQDETVTIIEREFPAVHLIKNATNTGFAQGNNLGMRAALEHGSSHIFLMNQDVVLYPSTLEELQRALSRSDDIGAAAPIQLSPEGDRVHHGFLNYLPKEFISDLVMETARDHYRIPFVPFGAILIRDACLRELGGLDSLFFLYCEDNEYCRRMQQNSWRIMLCPQARVNHVHTMSNAPASWAKQKNFAFSQTLLTLLNSDQSYMHCWFRALSRTFFTKRLFQRPKEAVARMISLVRCGLISGKIRHHRQQVCRVPLITTREPAGFSDGN